jgi:hypothetical protein
MELDDERERPSAGRLEKTKQERRVAVAKLLDVLDFKIMIC